MKVVFELDDLCDIHDPYEQLIAAKKRIPQLKVTMFAIPAMCSPELVAKYKALDWVELALHGFFHSNLECYDWSLDEAEAKITEGCARLGLNPKEAGFKSPHWEANGQTYMALANLGLWIADHPRQSTSWLEYESVPRYLVDMDDDLATLHGHTWDIMCNGPSWWSDKVSDFRDDVFLHVSQAVKSVIEFDQIQEDDCSWNHKTIWGENAASRFVRLMGESKVSGKVIDVGGNDGFAAMCTEKSWDIQVTVLDMSPFKIAFARHEYGLRAATGTADNIPFEDNEFEWGFCSHTLEHVPDLGAAMAEIGRVCKKGVYIIVPVETKEQFDANPAHARYSTHEGWLRDLGAKEVDRRRDELTCVVKF